MQRTSNIGFVPTEVKPLFPPLSFFDEDNQHSAFLDAVIRALEESPRQLPTRYLYDRRGSELFDLICTSQDYYPYRCEMQILLTHGRAIGEHLGERATIVELGSCNTTKIRLLLPALKQPKVYMPLDISGEELWLSAAKLQRDFTHLKVVPRQLDFTQLDTLPKAAQRAENPVLLFAGSTIGNFEPKDAINFLENLRDMAPGNKLLIGVDLKKDEAILNAAYNDRLGYTSAFNLNMLTHINRELDANFALDEFRHVAFYNKNRSRIEMHLESLSEQNIDIGGFYSFHLYAGERIHTENSYKYTLGEFQDLAAAAGFRPIETWTDARGYFSLQLLGC